MQNKDEIFLKIVRTILRLEVTKGHQKWSISEISRVSGVTRSLIYYYFGKDKKKMIEGAAAYIAQKVFALETSPKDYPLTKRIKDLLVTVKENPYLFILFFLNRNEDNELGKRIRFVEKRFFKKLKDEFPNLGEKELMLIYLIELGSLVYRDISDSDLSYYEEIMRKAFKV